MVSMDKGQADAANAALVRARQQVLAIVAGSGGGAQVPSLNAAGPLRGPAGDGPPPGSRSVLPFAVAVIDLVLLVVALAIGNYILAVGAAVLLVGTGAMAVAIRRGALAGRATGPTRWTSSQPWKGPLGFCQERALVVAATQAAERIARTPAWRSSRLDEQGARPDLVTDLDRIDDQAFRVAAARYDGERGGLPVERPVGPEVDQAWNRAVDATAALTCYADSLDGLDTAAARAAATHHPLVVEPSAIRVADGASMRQEDLALLLFFGNVAQLGDGS